MSRNLCQRHSKGKKDRERSQRLSFSSHPCFVCNETRVKICKWKLFKILPAGMSTALCFSLFTQGIRACSLCLNETKDMNETVSTVWNLSFCRRKFGRQVWQIQNLLVSKDFQPRIDVPSQDSQLILAVVKLEIIYSYFWLCWISHEAFSKPMNVEIFSPSVCFNVSDRQHLHWWCSH